MFESKIAVVFLHFCGQTFWKTLFYVSGNKLTLIVVYYCRDNVLAYPNESWVNETAQRC